MIENLRINSKEVIYEISESALQKFNKNVNEILLSNVDPSNIDLVCDDNVIVKANRMLLAGWSNYFESMFARSNFVEKNCRTLQVHNIDSVTLSEIVKFCYTGEISITLTNVQLIFNATDYLEIYVLRKKCVDFMTANVDEENCIFVLDIAQRTGNTYLAEKCKNIIEFNFIDVSKQPAFMELEKHALIKIIKTFRLCIPDEQSLYLSILNWIKNDLKTRLRFCNELMDLVNFPLIPRAFFIKQIKTDDVIDKSGYVCLYLNDNQKPLIKLKYNERLYVRDMIVQCGGWNYELSPPSYDDKMRCYDIETKSWHICGTLPRITDRQCVVILFNQIYMIGGRNGNAFSQVSNKVDIFDLKTKKWLPGKPMNFKRFDFHAGVIDDKIFVVGGKVSIDNFQSVVGEMYNPETNEWTVMTNLQHNFIDPSIEFVNDKIYFIETDIIQIFSPETNEWTRFPILDSFQVSELRTTVVNDIIYLYGQQMFGNVFTYNTLTNGHDIIKMDEIANIKPDAEDVEQLCNRVNNYTDLRLRRQCLHTLTGYKNTIYFTINKRYYPKAKPATIVYDKYSNSTSHIITSNHMSRAVLFAKIPIPDITTVVNNTDTS